MNNIKSLSENKESIRESVIQLDMYRIENLLSIPEVETAMLEKMHREIDSRYHAIIPQWGESMWCHHEMGFDYNSLSEDKDSLRDNLQSMMFALDGFLLMDHTQQNDAPNSAVNVVVNNSIDVVLSFNDMREQVEKMNALNQEQTDEILEKINELEAISTEACSKKRKWERIKPILQFAIEKGVDIALMFLTKVLEMKLQ